MYISLDPDSSALKSTTIFSLAILTTLNQLGELLQYLSLAVCRIWYHLLLFCSVLIDVYVGVGRRNVDVVVKMCHINDAVCHIFTLFL